MRGYADESEVLPYLFSNTHCWKMSWVTGASEEAGTMPLKIAFLPQNEFANSTRCNENPTTHTTTRPTSRKKK